MTTIVTVGDSVLDCGRYNDHGITPAGLLAQNDDLLFPEFRGRDVTSVLRQVVSLEHRAVDGSIVDSLRYQLERGPLLATSIALLTVGGNDLLQGLVGAGSLDHQAFERTLRSALQRLAHTQLFVGNVYDPSFGDDRRNFLDIDPSVARSTHRQLNAIIAAETDRAGGTLVDLHAHFLAGNPGWFTQTIEPSLTGASEVRRAFLAAWEVRHSATAERST